MKEDVIKRYKTTQVQDKYIVNAYFIIYYYLFLFREPLDPNDPLSLPPYGTEVNFIPFFWFLQITSLFIQVIFTLKLYTLQCHQAEISFYLRPKFLYILSTITKFDKVHSASYLQAFFMTCDHPLWKFLSSLSNISWDLAQLCIAKRTCLPWDNNVKRRGSSRRSRDFLNPKSLEQVFIGGIPKTVPEADIRTFASKIGEVRTSNLPILDIK